MKFKARSFHPRITKKVHATAEISHMYIRNYTQTELQKSEFVLNTMGALYHVEVENE